MASQAKKRALGGRHPRPAGAGAEEEREETAEGGDESGDEEDEEDEEDGEDEEDEFVNQEVRVDFEAHAPCGRDRDGIEKLLRRLFVRAPVDVAQLAGLVVRQSPVGSVLKQAEAPEDEEDEEDDEEAEVLGFISLLNLTEAEDVAAQISEMLLGRCGQPGLAGQLRRLLGDPARPVGLLLSERLANVPPHVALPLHRQLQKELQEAQRAGPPGGGVGRCFYYLMISKTFQEAPQAPRGRGQAPGQRAELVFANAEEEFFYEKALLKFSYSVQEESGLALGGTWSFDDLPMKPLRTVMVIPATEMSAIMATLKEYLAI